MLSKASQSRSPSAVSSGREDAGQNWIQGGERKEGLALLDRAVDQLAAIGDCDCTVRKLDSHGRLIADHQAESCAPALLTYPVTATVTKGGTEAVDPEIHLPDPQDRDRWTQQFGLCPQKNKSRSNKRLGGRKLNQRIPIQASVMVDSGASRCFVNSQLVNKHQISTFNASNPLKVMMADGEQLEARKAARLTLRFQEFTYTQTFFVLPLGIKASFILGIPFLQTISPFNCDARSQEITFFHREKKISIRPTQSVSEVEEYRDSIITLEQAVKDIRSLEKERKRKERKDSESGGAEEPLAYLCRLVPSRVPRNKGKEEEQSPGPQKQEADRATTLAQMLDSKNPSEYHKEIKEALQVSRREHELHGEEYWSLPRREALAELVTQEFQDIIREELPIREGPEVDYSKTPATIRFKKDYDGQIPYRLGPKFAPEEMKQCREILLDLLAKGYIKPSASPFGSPVLMVPKPGCPGKLRMVIDYRAINR